MNDQNERREAVTIPEVERSISLTGRIWQVMIDAGLSSTQRVAFLYVWWKVAGREWHGGVDFWTVDDGQIAEAIGANRQTARRAVARLVEVGLLEREGRGKGVRPRYRVGPALTDVTK